MGAGMIRLGGLTVFALFVVAVVGFVLLLDTTMSAYRPGMTPDQVRDAAGSAQVGIIALNILMTAMVAFVFWTTKGLFNNVEFTGGDLPIYIIIGGLVLSVVSSLAGGVSPMQLANIQEVMLAAGFIVVVSLLVLLLVCISAIWFAMSCLTYGRLAGSGLWKGVGVLYLLSFACLAVGMLMLIFTALTVDPAAPPGSLPGGAAIAAILFLVGPLSYLAGWICHGLGLLTCARRTTRARQRYS